MTTLKERCIHTIYQHKQLLGRMHTLPSELQDLIFLTLARMAALSDSHLSLWALYPPLSLSLPLLDLSHCRLVSDQGIKSLFLSLPPLQLEEVRLGEAGVTSQSIAIIAQQCSRLKGIDMGEMQGIKEGDLAMLKKCTELRTLVLRKVSGVKPRAIGKLLQYWPGIEYMEALLPSVGQLKKLTHLNCGALGRGSNKITSASFQSLLDVCPSLTAIDISGHSVEINELKSPNLRVLNISYTSVLPSSDTFLSTLQSNFPRLESLRMVELVAVRGIHLPTLATNTTLKELDLSKCISLDSANVAQWGKATTTPYHYSYLSLSGCKDITDASFTWLAGRLSEKLTVLDLSGVWKLDASLLVVASHCPNLTSLDLSLCKIISNQSIIAIARNCPQLRSLELYSCKNVTDDAILEIAENCPELTLLNLYALPVTDKSIACFGQKLRNLTSLDCSCTNIGDDSLRSFATGCPLVYFAAIGCTKITDMGVTQLARGCNNIQRLVLNECKQLTDQSLVALGQHMRFLAELSMLGCVMVSGAGILGLGKACQALRTLRLSSGSPITTAQIRALFALAPHLSLKL